MELPHRARSRLTLAALACVVIATSLAAALVALPATAAADDLRRPASATEPPRFFERSAREVERIAARAEKVREARADGRLDPTAYTKGTGRWRVSFFREGEEIVQVHVDDASGAVLEQWSGHQVAWTMARGYPGAFGRKLNAPYVWLPLCVLFLAPFVDFRRPFRLLHLDLLVLLAFGASHLFFNRGEIGVSVPLVYPVLAYLLARALLAAFRPRPRSGPLVPHVRLAWLVAGLVFLAAFRIGLNIADSNVIDVGYAGVIGADRIVDGEPLYGEGFSEDVERGDTYGPLSYLLYVPFEQALPWSGRWDDLPAAHAAAIAFDLLVIGGLLLLGRRLRPGRAGLLLGVALAYAWTAYPYTAFVLESNSNDSLVALAGVGAMLALTAKNRVASALGRGAALGLGAAAKFAPLALAALFARRGPLLFGASLALTLAATLLPFVPDGGLRELYDRTVGYQASRPSPFGIWGQVELDWLQTAVKAAALGLAVLAGFLPRRQDQRQTAALGAAVLIAIELAATHWFYLYVVWFVPFVLVTIFGAYGDEVPEDEAPAPRLAAREAPAAVAAA
ncbi:MAG TPA: glycosyltransferase 87 family protein [Thermoleophilaceae bacterium]|nr:glycosyltransferase 87 family protein [Thermoleophilaceae bacterium]